MQIKVNDLPIKSNLTQIKIKSRRRPDSLAKAKIKLSRLKVKSKAAPSAANQQHHQWLKLNSNGLAAKPFEWLGTQPFEYVSCLLYTSDASDE